MNFEDSIYTWYLQTSLNELRLAGVSCDVVIAVENNEWRAHKTVLSAASPYFCAMFNSEFKEARNDRVTLHDIDRESLAAILEFIYSSKIKITKDNVFNLMEASNFLQVYSVKLWISNFLQTAVSVENCIGLYERSISLNYHELAELALNFTKRNFSQVAERDEFLEVSAGYLMTLLSSKFLNVENEDDLIKCIMRWINADVEGRKGYIMDLMNQLELVNIPIEKLIELKEEPIFKEPVPNELQEFLDAKIAEWHATAAIPREPDTKWQTVRYGSEQGVILAMGGELDNVSTRYVECFTFGYDAFKPMVPRYIHSTKGPQKLTAMPPMNCARCNAAVACDAYNVYLIGGRSYLNYLSECETFNIQTRTWTVLPHMPQRLEGGSAVIFEGRLIFTGGRTDFGSTSRAWQWEEANKSWRSFPPLNYPRAFHSTISFGGYIYAIGGLETDNETGIRTTERYDPSQGKWFEVRPMNNARGKFGCTMVDNFIYVMGGIDRKCSISTVEIYNFESNTWSFMAPMLVPRYSFSIAVYEKKILCIGGHDGTRILQSVDKYNPATNSWRYLFSTQNIRPGLATAVLYLPYITRDV